MGYGTPDNVPTTGATGGAPIDWTTSTKTPKPGDRLYYYNESPLEFWGQFAPLLGPGIGMAGTAAFGGEAAAGGAEGGGAVAGAGIGSDYAVAGDTGGGGIFSGSIPAYDPAFGGMGSSYGGFSFPDSSGYGGDLGGGVPGGGGDTSNWWDWTKGFGGGGTWGVNPSGSQAGYGWPVGAGGAGGGGPLSTAMNVGSGLYGLYQGNQLMNQAKGMDPNAAYRGQYAAMMNQLLTNPQTIMNDPAYKQSVQATQRAEAAAGYNMSGNELIALQQNYGNFLNQKIAQLGGAMNVGDPGAAAAARTNATALMLSSLGNFGYAARGLGV